MRYCGSIMENNMSRQQIAKILFQFHHEIWNSPSLLDKKWDSLPKDRDFCCMYEVCKREYLRMADGVKKKVLAEKQQHKTLQKEQKNVDPQIHLPRSF